MDRKLLHNLSHVNKTVLECFGASSKREIIKRFVTTAVHILKADYGYSFQWNEQTQNFELFYRDANTPFVSQTPRKHGIQAQVFKSRRAQYISHAAADPKVRNDAKKYMKGVVVIPIAYKNNKYGTLDICFLKTHKFTTEERELCDYIGNGAAQAITINKLRKNLQSAKETLEFKVKERTQELTTANTKLTESESRLMTAEAVAHLGSWEWDLATDHIVVSNEFRKIYGLGEGADLNYEDFLQLVFQGDRTKVQNEIEKSLSDKKPFSFTHRMASPSGEYKILLSQGRPIMDGRGEVCKFIGTDLDVTEQKESETKLKEYNKELEESKQKIEQERARLNTLFESMGEGVIATDKEGNIITMNQQARELLRVDGESVIGNNLFREELLVDAKGHPVPTRERPMYRALHAGKHFATASLSTIYYYRNGNKTTVPLGITATPIRVDGEIVGAIQLLRDVSKEYEIDKVKSELISLASHQLRTPLSAINWFSETLLKEEVGKINKHQRKYMQEIFNANQKMVELVYDFLNVSRLELGTFTMKPINLSLEEVTSGVLTELEPTIKHKKLKLKSHIEDKPKVVYTDRKLVRIIIQNLLSNAVKYTPEGGKVSLKISYRQKSKGKIETKIVVSDTGIGIPQKQQEYIYSKLFRADNIKKLDTEGTGLGLYILKSFVDYCGGKTWFDSEEGKGTTFYVTLPVEPEKKVK